MKKKNLIINAFLGTLISAWAIFIGKVIIYHGLGYMGKIGGFKLDSAIVCCMIIFEAILIALFTVFNFKNKE